MHVSPSGAPGAQRTIAVTLVRRGGVRAALIADATRSLLGSAPFEDGLRRRWRPNERNVSLRDDEPIEVIA
jgi:hypothetical protein